MTGGSNPTWECVCFDNEGACCGDYVTNQNNNTVQIFRNWVTVESPGAYVRAYGPGHSFPTPIIARIEQGRIDIAGFSLRVNRASQSGVFVLAEYSDLVTPEKRYYFGGIGAYAYMGELETEWVGILPKTIEEFFNWLHTISEEDITGKDFKIWISACIGKEYTHDREYIYR